MTDMTEIQHCEVCGNTVLEQKIDLGNHPMCDDLIPLNADATCKEYPITILFCKECCTAHQKYQVKKQVLFPKSYHYRAKHTKDVQDGMKNLVSHVNEKVKKLSNQVVLDIGCNDGSLLNYFKGEGALTFGIEPTNAAQDAIENGHDVINGYFGRDVAHQFVNQHGQPDIITFTNVFAHIEDLEEVVDALKILKKPDTILVIENHYLGAILKKDQFDTFYHEHPRTYSLTSFVNIAKSLEMNFLDFEFTERYGGNIRVFLGGTTAVRKDVAEKIENAIQTEKSFGPQMDVLADRIETWKVNKSKEINVLVAKYGPLKAKAFPGRSAIPIKMLGLSTKEISAIYEKDGSIKVGNKAPGCDIPIVSDATFEISSGDNQPLINLAWHISTEIHGYMRKLGYKGPIIDIIDEDDFVNKG